MPKVQSGGVGIHYEVEGDGPPLVMQHGWSGSIEWWRECGFTDRLRDAYRLILIDLRGHGQSDVPVSEEAYATELMAADVLAVLDALQIARAHFFGYSMGGWIGFHLGLMAPDRFPSMVIGGAHPYPEDLQLLRDLAPQGGALLATIFESVGVQMSPTLKKQLVGHPLLPLAASVRRNRPDLSAALRRMQMPVLLYAGANDERHEGMRKCAGEMARGRFVSVPGLDHLTALAGGNLVVPFVRAFLDEQTATAGI